MRDTLEEQMTAKAQQGLLALGMDEDTAETYAPWLAKVPQFIPLVGAGVGVDNTRDALQEGRYKDAAIEGGLTLLGELPVVGDWAAAAIKGIRRAPVSLLDDGIDVVKKAAGKADEVFDEAAWLAENPRPYPGIKPKDMSPEQHAEWKRHAGRKSNAKNRAKRNKAERDRYAKGREGIENKKTGPRVQENPDFDSSEFDRQFPKPDGPYNSVEARRYRSKKSVYRKRAGKDGYDSIGRPIVEDTKFNNAEWERLNPHPVPGLDPKDMSPDQIRLHKNHVTAKSQAKHRADSEGYDDVGRAIKPETTVETRFTAAERRGMRTPPWADREGLLEVNKTRRQMEVDSGIVMEADHSPPLIGDYVSGLNLPQNIQFLPKDYHRQFGNQVGVGKNSLFYTPEATSNMYTDHLSRITENAEDIAYRQREKAKFVKGFSDQLVQDILSPHTKVGRNARKLWGDDAEKYLEFYREQLNLLGIPSK